MSSLENKSLRFPKICCITQAVDTPQVANIKVAIKEELYKFGLGEQIKSGYSVAIAVGSRGISNILLILTTLIESIKELEASPFIIPTMGSHGGGTAEGQIQVLRNYGITEETMSCSIKASMEVTKIGESDLGFPVYFDKFAASADKIIIVNKINTHSKFVGDVESGLSKMCLMGLGKHKGAQLYHRMVEKYSWPQVVESVRKVVIKKTNMLCGLAVLQNINKEIAEIHILRSEDFATKEPKLLKHCKSLKGQLPFKEVDLLIVDEMGKNIFGTGMDTSITGRKSNSSVNVQWLFVRDLTKETKGNAQGIGLADFTTEKVVSKIDFKQMYLNALTAFRTDSPKIPINLKNDKQVLETILKFAGIEDSSMLRILWIKNTAELRNIIISEPFFEQIDSRNDLDFIGTPEAMEFNSEGFLINSQKYW